MPGTGDVIYVLGPSLVTLALGVLILVVVRALRRGPAVTPRTAPDHGLLRPATEAAETPPDGDRRTPGAIPAQRSAENWGTVTRGSAGECLAVRPPDTVRARAAARSALRRR